jgi:hypothetical protein
MSPTTRRRLASLPALAAAWGLAAGIAVAAPLSPRTDARPRIADSPAEQVRKALDQVLGTVEIIDQPFDQAVAQLHEQTKINFVLDRLTIQQLGVDATNAAVNLKLQNVKCRAVLRALLGQYNLSYAVVGDTVVITSEDVAIARQLRQRVSVDLDRVPLAAALRQLARETATNLLLDARVAKEGQAAVTLQLEDVPLESAVRLMAEMAGLKAVRVGNVLFVTSKPRAAELRADGDLVPPSQAGPRAMEDVAVPVPAAAPGPPPAPPAPGKLAPAAPAGEKPAADREAKPAPPDKPPAGKDAPSGKPPSPKEAK